MHRYQWHPDNRKVAIFHAKGQFLIPPSPLKKKGSYWDGVGAPVDPCITYNSFIQETSKYAITGISEKKP